MQLALEEFSNRTAEFIDGTETVVRRWNFINHFNYYNA
jgi:hypothetical protein